ncbi:LTA synthase family protein [Marinifilum fragile]
MALYAVVNTVGLVANLADIFYYPYTLKRITWSIFDYLGTQANMSSLGGEFLLTYWYAFVLLGLLIGSLLWFFRYSLSKLKKTRRELDYQTAFGVWLLMALGTYLGSINNLNPFGESLQISDALDDVEQVEDAGIVLNSAFTLLSSYGDDSASTLPVVQPQEQKVSAGEFRPDNVVIIILESFTRETFGSLNTDLEGGSYRGYAPFLDSLMQKSLYFTHAYANGRKSMDAVPAILSSIPANQTPFILANQAGKKVESLASCLKAKGYETFFFHGSHNATMGFADFCQSADVDHYYGLDEYPAGKDFDGTWGIFDEPYLHYMAEKLDECKKPFLSTVFTLSSHNPYVVPKEYQGKFPKGSNGIHETMLYTDYALRQFFKTAASKAWYQNTLFVITADHAITPWHKKYATSANAFAIPLLFYAPGRNLKGKREERVQQIDVFPTVLSYLNYEEKFRSAGNNLLDPHSPKFAVSIVNQCYQMIQGDYLLLYDGKKCKALYQIEADPYQKHDIKNLNPKVVGDMLSLLHAHLRLINQNNKS